MHLLVFAILAAHAAYRPVWLALFGLLISAAIWRTLNSGRVELGRTVALMLPLRIAFGAIFGVFTIFYLANAWAPETSPDGAGYHLEVVSKYFHAHGFRNLSGNMYSNLSQGVEMLYQPAFAIGRHSATALVHFSFMIALAWLIFAFGRRIQKPVAGAAAALLVYASPVVGRDGTTAYVDVAVAAIAFAAFYWIELWEEQRGDRLLIVAGMLAGYAFAAKYTAFVMVVYALAIVAWRARKLRPLLIVTAAAVVMIAPWMVKNWIYARDPVAPFLSDVFRNPYVHILSEQEWARSMRRYDIKNLWTLPWEVTTNGGPTQGLIGPVFLLAPLGLVALRRRVGRRLLLAGGLLLAAYFGNIGTRFLIPCLPFFAMAMCMVFESAPAALAAIVVIHALASWPYNLHLYADKYVWRLGQFPYRAALRIMPQDEYLRRNIGDYELARAIDAHVPPGERVFSLEGVPKAYISRDMIESFQGALSDSLNDLLNVALWEPYHPERALVFHFPERTARRVRLVETARGRALQQWNVYELRYFDRGVEIARNPAWRLAAWPNPWDVQLAFDNSQATRWRSWETAAPGMHIDVDFGRAENLDEVRMETSHDFEWPIRLDVQTMDAQGRWVPAADRFEERNNAITGSLRRAATYELRARGFNYLAVGDGNYGAADFKDDPESWGLDVVVRTSNATLYRVVP